MLNRLILIAMILLEACATPGGYKPSKYSPLTACYISCPEGFMSEDFRRQHLCRGGRRWLTDVQIVDQYEVRGVDGTVLESAWVGRDGRLYDKRDVEIGACHTFIDKICMTKDCAHHPGEDKYGESAPQH